MKKSEALPATDVVGDITVGCVVEKKASHFTARLLHLSANNPPPPHTHPDSTRTAASSGAISARSVQLSEAVVFIRAPTLERNES